MTDIIPQLDELDRNLQASVEVLRRPDGAVVERTTMTNGNILDTMVFPGEYEPAGKPNEAGEVPMKKVG